MPQIDLDSELLEYIVRESFQPGARLPTINELQDEQHLGIGISKVREQLEVARALGLVEVRSKTGMRMKAYSFTPAVRLSLFFALAQDQHNFELFNQVRQQIEIGFWHEACRTLTDEDKALMRRCVESAAAKLNGQPIRIPNEEHRTFHLTIYRRLGNPFVMGMLEAYWDAYDAVELNRYADYSYLQQVWDYHARILRAIEEGDFDTAKTLLVQHLDLIHYQPRMQDLHRTHEPGVNGALTDSSTET